ncbi:hypothetical protein F0P96_17550 [Hymenobacter busanensis]|uniref:Uncharacterized protein n=1 Tax=Hymenobacter busanensis TaxID=2607656 RepID=A0A7L5A2G5_9BACT|nr:hypothetical protein [Hymenobacter busanensis]KAA9327046.1 hypothetical protein F0P96_17550 [Hymenobacter busanensis]QHJ09497.1 hypothetical protein GUY19_20365 [Hymenobacter busanensis]
MPWHYIGSCPDGERFLLDGVNVWDAPWHDTRRHARIFDPLYQQPMVFGVYELRLPARTITFAAGEFSNCVWGFFREAL